MYDNENVIQGNKEVEPGKEVNSMTSLSKYKVLHPTFFMEQRPSGIQEIYRK
jgi:hypothetical protein